MELHYLNVVVGNDCTALLKREKVSKWARLILANCNAMHDDIGDMKHNLQGRLRIGAMPSMSPVLPIILQRIRSAYPGVSVDVHFVGNDELKVSLDKYALGLCDYLQ